MSKPIAAALTLRLVRQGQLNLNDPIERWLPELANRRVLRRPEASLNDTVAAVRSITVDDLLSFRMGFGMMMDFSKPYPIVQEFERLELLGLGAPDLSAKLTPEEWLKRFASLPLMTQPGEMWLYNTAYYLLGVFLSRVTQKSLDRLFQEEIFGPLGMVDSGFTVPADKVARFTDCYWYDSENEKLELYDSANKSLWSHTPPFFDAAAGLVSTAQDYLAFARMLMSGGKHNGKTFLEAELVKAMTSNHLTPAQRAKPTFAEEQWKNHGYGYGVSVVLSESKESFGRVGQYGWDGGFGSTWRNDPEARLIGILLTQRTFDSPKLPPICEQFWREAYGEK